MPEDEFHAGSRIAITGIGAIMPGATDVDAFWRNIIEGRDLITDVPADRWLVEDHYDPDPQAPDKTYCKRGGFLPEVGFDPLFFGVPPNNLAATDTAQLLTLVVAEQVLADATAGRPEGIDRERAGVIVGSGMLKLGGELGVRLSRPLLLKVLRERGMPESEAQAICDSVAEHSVPFQEASFPGLLGNIVAGRVANRFDLHGTNCTVDAACASSLGALSMAVDELVLGRADLMITGGVDTMNDPMMFVSFSKTPALSATGDCRPFAEDADGTVLGEGLALFTLKRLADAERDGDRIYAVITGIGSSSDGRSTSIYGPLASGQERALRRAYAAAGYGPETVGLLEAHGTGTTAGDHAELAALRAVFGAAEPDARQWCALGSVKSQIGHTKAAAGAAGLLKAVLALHHKVLPPTIKVDRPNPALALDSGPFYLNTTARPWVEVTGRPRRASVSSFGFGGTNFHVTLEEYSPPTTARLRSAPRSLARPAELLVVSADSPAELVTRCAELAGELADETDLAGAVRRAQQRFRANDAVRLAVVAAPAELAGRLDSAVALVRSRPDAAFSTPTGIHYGVGSTSGRIAFLFPGQGTQHPGMGAELAMHFPAAQDVWDRLAGPGQADVVFPRPAFDDTERAAQRDQLAATDQAQPALAAHGVALLEVLDSLGVRPDCVAGHSFGELVALHAAGAFDAETLMRIARRRGELMRDASAGAMLAVDAAGDEVATRIAELGVDNLWIANHNAPRQVVVSGSVEAVAKLQIELTESGVTARPLATSAAFHSPPMAGVADPLHEFLRGLPIRAPLLDVYGNADAGIHASEPDRVRRAMADHVAAPVRFAEMIRAMYEDGVRTFVDTGPGSTLTGLVGHILADVPHHGIVLERQGRDGVTGLCEALARLAVLSVPITFDALWEHHRRADRRSPGMRVGISGGNHGRPYPPTGGATALPAPNFSAALKASAPTHAEPTLLEQAPATWPDRPPSASIGHLSIVESLIEVQRQTARAHATYLATAEKTLAALLQAGSAAPGPAVATPSVVPPPAAPTPPPAVAVATPRAEPVPQPEPAADLTALVLSVVADKTGYPVDMLGSHMELEADLGLDSITRTQILAALRPTFPMLEHHLRSIDLAALRTVDDIAAALRELTADAPQPPLHRLRTVTVCTEVCGQPMLGLRTGPLVITDDGRGVAEQLARLLTERGMTAEVGDQVSEHTSGVVFLGGLAEVSTVDEALAVQRDAFRAARAAAGTGGVFVTVQDTGGAFGPSVDDPLRAWLGGIASVARTAAQEWPSASVKAIDCAPGSRDATSIAGSIANELLLGGSDLDVGLSCTGVRRTLDTVAAPATPGPGIELGPESVVVVSGGGRGVTAAVVRALARRYSPRFVLIGRTPLCDEPTALAAAGTEEELLRVLASKAQVDGQSPPPLAVLRRRARDTLAAREVRTTLAALAQAGCPTRYLELDIRDATAVASALGEVRAVWGPISAVLHGAGVPSWERITDKTDEQFDRVFDTKVGGLRALLSATSGDPLRLLCAFSSVAGRFGFPGQSDYAMANETLDHVLAVEQTRRPGCLVRSVQWGPWHGGMVSPMLEERLRQRDVGLIEPEAGAEAFVAELGFAAEDPRIVISGSPSMQQIQLAASAVTA